MTSSTEQLIAQYFSAFNHADWEGMLSLLSPNVVHDVNDRARQSGLEAFTEYSSQQKRHFLEVLSDIVIDVPGAGQRAIARYVVSGQYLATQTGLPPARGQRYRIPGESIFDVDGGHITRIISHFDEDKRLQQLSSEE
jgi:steroid delta-isomerase-like uncharacterized protein